MAKDANPYLGLRDLALHVKADEVGAGATEAFGVVTDMVYEDGTSATVVAMHDGSASIYLSSGGGFIGGMSHANVRQAAVGAVEIASSVVARFQATSECPLPQPNYVAFHILTRQGALSATVPTDSLDEHSPYYPLYAAVHEVITQYRLITAE